MDGISQVAHGPGIVIDFFRAGSWIDLTYSKASLSWPKEGPLRLGDPIFNRLV